MRGEDNHTDTDGRFPSFETQPSFFSWWNLNEGQPQGEVCFSGQLAITLAQLRLTPEVLWCSTSKTAVFKTMEKQLSRRPSEGTVPAPVFTRNSCTRKAPLLMWLWGVATLYCHSFSRLSFPTQILHEACAGWEGKEEDTGMCGGGGGGSRDLIKDRLCYVISWKRRGPATTPMKSSWPEVF